jgi:hypothetical protein
MAESTPPKEAGTPQSGSTNSGEAVHPSSSGRESTSKGGDVEKKTKTVQLKKEKATKNTVRFAEVETEGEALVFGSLYVQKWFAGAATSIKVMVELE